MNHYFPNSHSSILGWLPIPGKYACWAELFIIELVTPNTSFVGHFSGILTGLLYTYGPLKDIVGILKNIVDHQPNYRTEPSAPPEEEEEDEGSYGAFSGRGATWGSSNNYNDNRSYRRYGWNI